jgi:hypothetical protein
MFNLPYDNLPKLNVSNKKNIRSSAEIELERKVINKFYYKDQVLYKEIKKKR